MFKRICIALSLAFLCGCFKVKDELTIQPDGSGTVRIETRTGVSSEMMMDSDMPFESGGPAYPPLTEAQARKLFPGKDFKVTVQRKKTDDETVVVVEATFKDINALLGSPYATAHQLSLKLDGNALALKALSGLEGVARMAEMKDESGMAFATAPGLAEMQKKNAEMRTEFRVTMPNTITTANGDREGKTAAWIVERAKFKDASAFATQLGTILEARCAADGLKMTPATPVRLGLAPFKELAGGAQDKGAVVDTNKIAGAAKFTPYALHVTRSLDLSGEGGGGESGAQLIGAVTVPPEYKPQRWGEVKLTEAIDSRGRSLKFDETEGDGMRMRRSSYYSSRMFDEGEDSELERTNAAVEERHIVTLTFRPPDWKITEIARLKGSLPMHYFSGSQLVKLTNAIPANWIIDQANFRASGRFDSSEKKLNDPTLTGLGLGLTLSMAMTQSEMTMLMFSVEGDQATVLNAQVFDADGKPWPTFVQGDSGMGFGREGGATMCSITVAGKPRAPLSLALQVSGSGTTVDVPILLEHVPVGSKSK